MQQNEPTQQISHARLQKRYPTMRIGEDEDEFAVDLDTTNTEKKGRPVKDLDRGEKQLHFDHRLLRYNKPELAAMAEPLLPGDVRETSNLSLISGKTGHESDASLHRVVKPEMVGDGERGRALAERRQKRRFPRENFGLGKLQDDHIRIYGNAIDAFGSLGLVKGKFEEGFIIDLDQGEIEGNVGGKSGFNHNTHNISNVEGDVTGTTGNPSGFITKVNVTDWGNWEQILLLFFGYDPLLWDGTPLPSDLAPKPGSAVDLYRIARKAYETGGGGYTPEIKALYDLYRVELARVWKIAEEMQLPCYLDLVTTADWNAGDWVYRDFFEKCQARYEQAKKDGVENPVETPFVLVRHESGNLRTTIALFSELDGRSDAEKQWELPDEPVIRNISATVHWRSEWMPQEEIEWRTRANEKISRKNIRRQLRGKEPLPLWPVGSLIPECVRHGWDGERKLTLRPIIEFPKQPDREVWNFKPRSESDEHFHARMFRKYRICPRHPPFWIEDFYVSVPVYAGTGKVKYLICPKMLKMPPGPMLHVSHVRELLHRPRAEALAYVDRLQPKKPQLSAKALQYIKGKMKPLPKEERRSKAKQKTKTIPRISEQPPNLPKEVNLPASATTSTLVAPAPNSSKTPPEPETPKTGVIRRLAGAAASFYIRQ